MLISRALAALTAFATVYIQPVSTHSTERNPLRYISPVHDATIHTRRVHAHSVFEITFYLHDHKQKIRLSLEPNHDILWSDAVLSEIQEDGSVRIQPIDRRDHKIFKGDAFIKHPGHSEWTNVGWARINVHRDGDRPIFEGGFRIDGNNHHIQTQANYLSTRHRDDPIIEDAGDVDDEDIMVVWRDSDIISSRNLRAEHSGHEELKRDVSMDSSCSSDSLDFNADLEHPVYRGISVEEEDPSSKRWWGVSPRSLFARQSDIDGGSAGGGNGAGVNLSSTVGKTTGCPPRRKVALVGLAADCTYVTKWGGKDKATSNIVQQVNLASQVFESSFNISLAIQNLTVQSENCPAKNLDSVTAWNADCNSDLDIGDRLNLFSKWRGRENDTNAYWTLLTNCPTKSAVGLAWLGQLCVQGSQENPNQTVAGANVVVHTSNEWQVFAHESGHTFGAVHDCMSETCSDGTATKQQCCPLSDSSCDAKGGFIMNPSAGEGISKFSPCTIGNICSGMSRQSIKTQCLTDNKGITTFSGSQCGNGIVEAGEDCDCGGEAGCGDNPCCNPKTCKFNTDSVCDFSNEDCCTHECKFTSNSTVCRASTGACDPAEMCPGDSGSCPKDLKAKDGDSCGDSGQKLACASGQCTSRDLQCKTLMGYLTQGNDTYSCSSSGCGLSCGAPEFGYGTCATMNQNFLDGTPCEGGGTCSNGQCEGKSVGKEIGNFFTDPSNKKIIIPVATVVGAIIVLIIVSCCWSSYKRRKRRAAARTKQPPPGWGGVGPDAAWMSGGSNMTIPPPQQAYAGGNRLSRTRGPPGSEQWEPFPPPPPPGRSMSTRYA